MKKTRLIMVGGFLGAGKTTTLARLAKTYLDSGQRVVIVTNDQATDLVDTHTLRSLGFDVAEVAGACFCCRFDELIGAIGRLGETQQPDVILAEPVGSCTDLVATVIRPLQNLYGERFEVAPYGVILKPKHGRRILGGEKQAGFSPQAAYIFRKQLEEADFILVNRVDELPPDEIQQLVGLIHKDHPQIPVFAVSARTGEGFEPLIELLDQEGDRARKQIELNYDIYAAGEAELGWLNCRLTVQSDKAFSLDGLLLDVVDRIGRSLAEIRAETAHLKTIGLSDGQHGVANLISSDSPAELSYASRCETSRADVIINARVAVDPETLAQHVREAVRRASAAREARVDFQSSQQLRPGRPEPTYRLQEADKPD